MADPIRILIADDHAVVRYGIRALIASDSDMVVVGEAADGIGAVTQAQALLPDVLLLDLLMPGKHGIQVLEELAQVAPSVKVLVLTTFVEDEQLFPALKAGAAGYLLKESGPRELLDGIREVAQGKSALHPAIARRVLQELAQPTTVASSEGLTSREEDVLKLVAQGRSNKAIATQLDLSERTVRSHVSSILSKLRLASRTQAALYALRNGLAHLDGCR